MVMKSSGLSFGSKRDFGVEKTFESYVSDTEILGMITVWADTRVLNTHWAIRRVTSATAPCLPKVTSRYDNDVTSLQDNISFQILSFHNVLIGHGNHHLLRFSLPVLDVAKHMDIITGGEERKTARIGYPLYHTGKRLENNLPGSSDFADCKDMITIDLLDLNRHSRRRHEFEQCISHLLRKDLSCEAGSRNIPQKRQ